MAKNENKIGRNPAKKMEEGLKSDTKRGIVVVVLFTIAVISLLSFFNLAGQAGVAINQYLKIFFGWAYIVFPIALILIGYFLLSPSKFRIGGINYLGVFIFFLSLNGLLHLSIPQAEAVSAAKAGIGGGYLGLFLSYSFQNIMGFWASLIVLIALVLISLLLIFNTTLHRLAYHGSIIFWPLRKIFGIPVYIRNLFRRAKSDDVYEEAPMEEPLPQFSAKAVEPVEIVEEKTGQMKMEPKKPAEPAVRIRRKIDMPFSLLSEKIEKPTSGDIEKNMETIQKTLENFNIPVEMGEVSVGPTVTQYTLKPADGIKLASITSLGNDLALSLAAHPIRIEAPIPGKSLVGIEVPNQKVAIVQLRETLDAEDFRKRKSSLMIALGKDVSGKPWLADLAKMPHLLIAGATGSGKSVCLNAVIISLLYQNNPDDLKFIMVDPKRVELTVYNNIPHLLTPVITDVKKTVNALRWALGEMDRRYDLLEKTKKRDIYVYNASTSEKLPFIVITVDELADLMLTAAAEVEGAIIRLAQMARAVGIHLILATQRPSVDIITGLIKANITSRIAFSVASAVDSRTILDTSGAEKLLGRGDMLFISAELSKPKRLQGAFVSDAEIHRVVDFLKQNGGQPEYQEDIVQKQAVSIPGVEPMDSDDDDELLVEAKQVILQAGKASASLLQRRLKVGYARAARLLDLLEEQGMISPGDGAKPRDVLVEASFGHGETVGGPSEAVEAVEEAPEEVVEPEVETEEEAGEKVEEDN